MSRQIDRGLVENFFRLDGRLNRWPYFKRTMLIIIVELILLTAILIVSSNELDELSSGGLIVFKAVCIVATIPLCFLMIRRLHDMNMPESVAYVFFALNVALTLMYGKDFLKAEPSSLENMLSCLIGAINLLTLFWPGTKGSNAHGSDPTR